MKKLFLIFAFFSASAFAQMKNDGNELLADLQNGSDFRKGISWGYISGIADYSPYICPPEGVIHGQIYDIVKNYLEQTPSIRHFKRQYIIEAALVNAFPCKQEPTPKPKKPV
jgi:hypothetical protein